MRIAGIAHDRGACNYLRIVQVLQKIGDLKLAEVDIIRSPGMAMAESLQKSDVVVFGRSMSDEIVRMCNMLRSHGKRVVFDLDDNFFSVSPYSPHFKDLGIMPVELHFPGGVKKPLWADSVNGFKVRNNRKVRMDFIKVVRAASAVTVTTPPLKEVYGRYNDDVEIVPNALDMTHWREAPIRKRDDGTVRLVYTGAANHFEDWMYVRPVLERLQQEHGNLVILLVGTDWKHLQPNNLDYSRIEVWPWVDIETYPYLMKTLAPDIGIAPISKVDFNDCRSSIKWMEYSMLGAASCATSYGPYKRDCVDGETALLVDSQDDWYGALTRLITDERLRNRIMEKARAEVKDKYNLDKMAHSWLMAYSGKVN